MIATRLILHTHHRVLPTLGCSVLLAVVCAAPIPLIAALAAEPVAVEQPRRHGITQSGPSDELMAWSTVSGRWMTPVEFWREWASNRGGLRWGQGRDYPPYNNVEERDLFLVELDSGLCLMEFWHSRWRRAQDVRRWSPEFNKYGGCPNVFD